MSKPKAPAQVVPLPRKPSLDLGWAVRKQVQEWRERQKQPAESPSTPGSPAIFKTPEAVMRKRKS